MSRITRRRIGRLCAATATVLTVLAAAYQVPASAADTRPYGIASLRAISIAVGMDESTAGKTASAYLSAYGDDLPDRFTVKIDASSAAGVLLVAVKGAGCTTDGEVTTCAVPFSRATQDDVAFLVNMKVALGAAVGDMANLKMTVSGAGLRTNTTDNEILVVESNADLVAKTFTATDVKPGDVRGYRPAFVNSGDMPAPYVGMWINDDAWAPFTTRYSNCRYQDVDPEPGIAIGYCEFKLDLAPGETAEVSADTPLTVKVAPDAPSTQFVYSYYQVDVLDGPLEGDLGTPGTGPELKLDVSRMVAARTADADPSDNWGYFAMRTATSPADIVALGARVSGAIGETRTLGVGLRNDGPATVLGHLDGEGASPDRPTQPAVDVTLPAGVKVTRVPDGMQEPHEGNVFCAPVINGKADWTKTGREIGLVYRCTASRDLGPGESEIASFKVSITGTTAGTGSVVAAGGDSDPNPANNTATIEFAPAGGSGGGLPVTGGKVGVAGGIGAAALVAGALLLAYHRRRRVVLVAEDTGPRRRRDG